MLVYVKEWVGCKGCILTRIRSGKCVGHILFNAHLPSVADLINDNPDVEEEEGEGGEESGEESGEEVEEGGGEGEGEKKRKGKRKRRGLCVHVRPVLTSFYAWLYHVHVG